MHLQVGATGDGHQLRCDDDAAAVVETVSRFAATHPEVAELEINPLAVTVGGVWALDARIILDQGGGTHAGG